MLVAVLFLLALGGVVLAVAVLALRRQIVRGRVQLFPAAPEPKWRPGHGEKAPIISVPATSGEILTIGGALRNPQFVLLVFVEAGSPQCEAAVNHAVDLCRVNRARLILVGSGVLAEYGSSMPPQHASDAAFIISDIVREDFRMGAVPSAVLLDAHGFIVARGALKNRDHLAQVLAHVSPPAASAQA